MQITHSRISASVCSSSHCCALHSQVRLRHCVTSTLTSISSFCVSSIAPPRRSDRRLSRQSALPRRAAVLFMGHCLFGADRLVDRELHPRPRQGQFRIESQRYGLRRTCRDQRCHVRSHASDADRLLTQNRYGFFLAVLIFFAVKDKEDQTVQVSCSAKTGARSASPTMLTHRRRFRISCVEGVPHHAGGHWLRPRSGVPAVRCCSYSSASGASHLLTIAVCLPLNRTQKFASQKTMRSIVFVRCVMRAHRAHSDLQFFVVTATGALALLTQCAVLLYATYTSSVNTGTRVDFIVLLLTGA